MRRRTFLRGLAASPLAALGIGRASGADSQLEPGTWYDATVLSVTDGDTMDVELDEDGTEYEVRHLGIDTPETSSNSRYEEVREWEGIDDETYLTDWGENAKTYAQDEFPEGTSVQVAVDEREEEIDPFGRLLAYVRYDETGDGSFDTLYNEDVLRKGYARVYSSSLTRHDEFWAAERAARDEGARVWQDSDLSSLSEVGNDPVSTVYFPNASSVRTTDGAIADSRVPVYAASTATQDLDSGGVSYDRIPMVGVDESAGVALVGGLFVNESNEGDDDGEHRVFLSNLVDDLSSRTGPVLVEGGHRQFNAQYGLSCEDTVVYQRFLEGVDVTLEGTNSVDGSEVDLSNARGIVITTAPLSFSQSEIDALSTYLSNGGCVVLLGSALATDQQRSNLHDLAAGIGTDLRLNADQVFDGENNTGDSAFITTSEFDTTFDLFDSYTPDSSSDAAPSVSWANPADGETVFGTVTVQIDASDAEDGTDSLEVTYSVDGGSERATAYNAETGYYEDSWDTTTVADGDHTLAATAMDSAGNSSSSSITVTTDNTEDAPVVDTLSTGEVETDDGDAAFDVDWSVSDADGDLSTVDLVLTDDAAGETEDSASVSVAGDTASGTTRLVAAGDDGSGNSYTVEVTVADADGNTDTATTTAEETESIARSDVLTAAPDTAGADSFHTWTLSDPAYSGEVDTITVDYPSGTSLDGLTNDAVAVFVDTDGDGTAEEIRVNSDSYAGSTDVFDLDGRYDTTVAGEVCVEIDGVTNPGAGDYVATETLDGEDTLSVDAEFAVSESALAVSTGSASNVTDSSATLSGALDDLGGADSADCYFQYRETGSDTWTATSVQTLSATGSFSEDASGLSADTEYEFRALADASDGDSDAGASATFTTDGDTVPTIDQFAVTDESNPQWDHYSVDWTVGDGDGDLAEVTTELRDAAGATLDSDSDAVGGSTASGDHFVRSKSTASEVVLTVTDAAGNSTSSSTSV